MRILKLFRKEPKPRRTVVFQGRPTDVRKDDFRRNREWVQKAKEILDDPRFQMMMAVARTEAPDNYGVPVEADVQCRAARQAINEGYNRALNLLEQLGTLSVEPEALQPTWEPEELDDLETKPE